MVQKILSGDSPNITLDGYRAPDGDPILIIGKKYFKFCIGSQPFEQTEIYKFAAKLVDAIVRYKEGNRAIK